LFDFAASAKAGAHRDMHRFRRRALSTAAIILLSLGAPAATVLAEEHGGHGEAHGGGHGDAHGDAHGAHKTVHLDNWFSFDYGPGKTFQNGPLGFAILNFIILIVLLVKFTRKPLTGYLQDRHETIKKDLDQAAVLRDQARTKLDEIEAKLGQLDDEVAQIRADVAQDAKLEKERIIEAAHKEAERIIKQADKAMDREIRRARRTLESEAVEAALKMAEELVAKNINFSDRKKINERYIAQIAQPASSGGDN